MSTKIFINLPVKSLPNSIEFYTALGYKFNPAFTDETATCMIISDDIFVMLMIEERFKTFTPNAVCDAKKATEVLLCISCDSRADVDSMVKKAVAAGGNTHNEPVDHGFMYIHGYQDIDGHLWEVAYMQAPVETGGVN